MDPISIIAGALALGEACVVIATNIRRLVTATGSIDSDLESLVQEIDSIAELCDTVQKSLQPRAEAVDSGSSSPVSPGTSGSPSKATMVTEKLWEQLGNALEGCRVTVRRLNDIVLKIQPHATSSASSSIGSKLDAVNKVMRKKLQEGELRTCRAQLSTFQRGLSVVLTTMIYHDLGKSTAQNSRSFRDLSKEIRKLDERLQSQIFSQSAVHRSHDDIAALKALEDLRSVVATAAEAIKTASTNAHFDIPQSVSTIFTGREDLLAELRHLFIPRPGMIRDHMQRRFVVHGLAGSGKTQFCSKFAQDNRESFWGVFWIDASTEERIKQTLGVIAGLARREKNESAALHWLSSLDHRWLLIIDNADDEGFEIEKYFPRGNRGNILITTRNEALTVHGNVGPKHYHFRGLQLTEATSLLLKASNQPEPWDQSCEALASTIAEALGYLALAIVHAGAAIRDKLCSLRDYLPYYRRRRRRLLSAKVYKETDAHAAVFTTWEICFERLEEKGTEAAVDALELLNVLAYLHWENISPDTFDRALENPAKEYQLEMENSEGSTGSGSWTSTLRSLPLRLYVYILTKSRGPPLLPGLIRDAATGVVETEDATDRVRAALAELSRLSLIIRNEHNDTYSVHPLVHAYARERPRERLADGNRRQVRLIDEALCAEMTGRLLSASILLPPLGTSQDDEDYHISLLPHIEHVQERRAAIASAMEEKRRKPHGPSYATGSSAVASSTERNKGHDANAPTTLSSWICSLVPPAPPDPVLLRMHAKFAFVYAKCGQFAHAETLLLPVKDALTRSLGLQDPKTVAVSLFLSTIYWRLGRPADAATLQQSVIESCRARLGPSHPNTLRAMGELGKTRWQQGMYSAARDLQIEVLRELTETHKLGNRDADVLDAMDSLAMTLHKFWEDKDFEEALRLHSEAAEGMAEVHGVHHERTLSAKENSCRVAVLLGGKGRLELARERMEEVLAVRRRRLGTDHPFTLLAMVNMAIVLAASGEPEEAERLILEGLPVADTSLGEEHIGTLFGRHTLACIVAQTGRYAEAEALLRKVTDAQKRMGSHRGDYHPDRLGALIELANCCYAQGKIAEAVEICNEAITGFKSITRSEKPHPLTVRLMEVRKGMLHILEGGHGEKTPGQHHVKFPFILFRAGEE